MPFAHPTSLSYPSGGRTSRKPHPLRQQRDILSRTKQSRDSLRIDNQRLRGQCGLLANKSLLADYECRVDESCALNRRIGELMATHADLTMNLNTMRMKINQANAQNNNNNNNNNNNSNNNNNCNGSNAGVAGGSGGTVIAAAAVNPGPGNLAIARK